MAAIQRILNIGTLPLTKAESIECGRIKRRVTDDRARSVHELRHEIMAIIEALGFLGPDQRSDLVLVIGEALDNACKSPSDQRPVDIAWEKSSSAIRLNITNPSDKCRQGQINLPEDCFTGHGRGLTIIQSLVNQLGNKDGIHANCDLCYFRGRMTFQIIVGR